MRIYGSITAEFDDVISSIRESVRDDDIDGFRDCLDELREETENLREYCNGLNLTINRTLFEFRERFKKLEKR